MVSSTGNPVSLAAVVFDLDGVIRHYDRMAERAIEARHGLHPGALMSAAFGGALGRRFMCGELDHDQFASGIAAALGSPAAAEEFISMRAHLDPHAVEVVQRVRSRVPVGLLTNGSLRTRVELAESGLTDAFDHIENSAESGVPKPDPAAYHNALAGLGADASSTAFVDDLLMNVEGAHAVGMVGHHFQGLDALRAFLTRHRLLEG